MAININSAARPETALMAPGKMQNVSANGWTAGFSNIFGKELSSWFGGRRWLIQAITWTAILNGIVALVMFILPIVEKLGRDAVIAQGEVPPPLTMTDSLPIGLSTFFSLAAIAGAIGMIIMSQDQIVGEKQMGTAAWILSKPVSRTAFILSKLAAHAIGILTFALALPAVITYIEVSFAVGHPIEIIPFLLALPLVAVTLLFYLSLSLMLGVLLNQRGPLLSILFGFLFGGTIIAGTLPFAAYVLPLNLGDLAGAVAAGMPMPIAAIGTMLATLAWSSIFIVVAVRRFQRQEL